MFSVKWVGTRRNRGRIQGGKDIKKAGNTQIALRQ